jgi:hypothetical protein
MAERILYEEGAVLRHTLTERLEHWILAISGFILLFSGVGELPMYKRYMVTEIPGLSWAGDFFINLKIHYLAAIVFVSVMAFHALYHAWLGHRGLLPRKGDFRDSAKTILSMFGFGEEPVPAAEGGDGRGKATETPSSSAPGIAAAEPAAIREESKKISGDSNTGH